MSRPKDDGITDRVALERALGADEEVFGRLTQRELEVLAHFHPRRVAELWEGFGMEPELDLRYQHAAPVSLVEALDACRAVEDGATKTSVARQLGVTRDYLNATLDRIGAAA